MSIPVTWDGVTFVVPEAGEKKWGAQVTSQLRDLLKSQSGSKALLNNVSLHLYESTSSSLSAGAQLTPTHPVHKIQGASGPVTLDTVAAIPNGSRDGQILILEGSHATNTVTIQNGANVQLREDIILGLNDSLTLRWDTTVGDWREVTRKMSHKLHNQLALELYEARANGTEKISIRAPSSLSANQTWTLPSSQVSGHLKNDGSGGLLWDPGVTFAFESVKAYGAVGDGVADDTTPIQNAINTVVTAGAGVVFFPKGSYKVTASLTIPITARNLTMWGPGATIEGYVNAGILIISDTTTASNRAEKIAVIGLSINGRGATDATYPLQNGVELYAALDVVFRDVAIQNIPQHGFVGLKSAQAGSAFWNLIELNQVKIRFIGKDGLSVCKTGAAGDDLTVIGCMFNNLGKKYTTEPTSADGGVFIAVSTLTINTAEVSGVRNDNGTNGFTRAMVLRKCNGTVSGLHFEDNCNNQASSYDLLLDTDADGLVVSGSNHSCNTVTSAAHGIRCTSKNNVLDGIRMDGGATHVFGNVVDVSGSTNPTINGVGDNGTPPSNKYVAFTSGTEAVIGAIQGDFLAHQILLPNNKYLRAREVGSTIRQLLGLNASDQLILGDATGTVILKTGSVEGLRLDSSQRVSIGQTGAITAKLHVEQSGNLVAARLFKTGTGAGNAVEIENDGTGNGLNVKQDGAGSYAVFIDNTASGASPALGVRSAGTDPTALFQADGNSICVSVSKSGVGAGVALDVGNAGTSLAFQVVQTGSQTAALIKNNTDNIAATIQKNNTGTTNVVLKVLNASTSKWIDTDTPQATPAHLPSSGVWTDGSCFLADKENLEAANGEDFLQKILKLRIRRYTLIAERDKALPGNGAKWFGPLMDDLVGLFGLNDHGSRPKEMASIALVAIQEIVKRLNGMKRSGRLPEWQEIPDA